LKRALLKQVGVKTEEGYSMNKAGEAREKVSEQERETDRQAGSSVKAYPKIWMTCLCLMT
jgi:hypothetical protein